MRAPRLTSSVRRPRLTSSVRRPRRLSLSLSLPLPLFLLDGCRINEPDWRKVVGGGIAEDRPTAGRMDALREKAQCLIHLSVWLAETDRAALAGSGSRMRSCFSFVQKEPIVRSLAYEKDSPLLNDTRPRCIALALSRHPIDS